MNPLRYAKALAWTVVLLAVPRALPAQPCTAKQQYDDAEKAMKKAEQELTTLQTKNKQPLGKIAKADHPTELADRTSEKVIRDQNLKDAEKELADAKKDKVNFGSDPNKGKRLTDLTGLIKAHNDKIAAIQKELDAKKTDISKIDAAKQSGTSQENDIKRQMPGIPLGANMSDVDDAKKHVDDDVARLQQELAKNQKRNGHAGALQTALRCPELSVLKANIDATNAIIAGNTDKLNRITGTDTKAVDARDAIRTIIQDQEKELETLQDRMPDAVTRCQKTVNDNLTQLSKKRYELEQLDPDRAIEKKIEELAGLKKDTSLEMEQKRLVGEQKVIDDLVTKKTEDVKNSRIAKEGADARVDEVNKNIEIENNKDLMTNLKPAYDIAVADKDLTLQQANTDLTATRTFLVDWNAVKVVNGPYQNHKKTFLENKKNWDDRVKAWQANKDPRTAQALRDERARLAADKAVLDREKAQVVAVLKARNLNYKNLCDRKQQLADALKSDKANLENVRCFKDAADAITEIDTRTNQLGAFIEAPRVLVGGPSPASPDASAPPRELPTLLEALECKVEDLQLEEDLEALEEEIVIAEFDPTTEEPTDSVPGDITKESGEVKVARYFVFLLTGASNGLYVGDEDELKKSVRCGFVGGGIGCKPTDLITYKKLHGPFPTQAEAQAALCQSVTETRYFPAGIGLKGRWQGGNTWYGLWNASVSDCPRK